MSGASIMYDAYSPVEISERPLEDIYCEYKKTEGTRENASFDLEYGNYVVYRLPCNSTGFVRAKLTVKEKTTIYFTFSETLRGGFLYRDSQVSNIIKITYLPGEYIFESFTEKSRWLRGISGRKWKMASERCAKQRNL